MAMIQGCKCQGRTCSCVHIGAIQIPAYGLDYARGTYADPLRAVGPVQSGTLREVKR